LWNRVQDWQNKATGQIWQNKPNCPPGCENEATIVANGWIIQNPSINGYSGAFGYSMPGGVTIVAIATKSEIATTDAAAFDILREVVKYVTPGSPIDF
jgi:hypothetical protein